MVMSKKVFSVLFLLCVSLALFNCGGGGSSGGGGGGDGVSGSVAITENNAQTVAENAFENIDTAQSSSDSLPGLGMVSSTDRPSRGPRSQILPRAVMDLLNKIDLSSSQATYAGQVYKESATEYGTCGGKVNYSLLFFW